MVGEPNVKRSLEAQDRRPQILQRLYGSESVTLPLVIFANSLWVCIAIGFIATIVSLDFSESQITFPWLWIRIGCCLLFLFSIISFIFDLIGPDLHCFLPKGLRTLFAKLKKLYYYNKPLLTSYQFEVGRAAFHPPLTTLDKIRNFNRGVLKANLYVCSFIFFFYGLFFIADGCVTLYENIPFTEVSEQKQPSERELLEEQIPEEFREQLRHPEYLRRAQQGDADAQAVIGLKHQIGEGVPRDEKKAAKWWRKAAEQGHATSQFKLGEMYWVGEGVPRDYVLAHMWKNLALSNETDDDSRKQKAESLDYLEELMTRAQISEAQKLAREFKPKARF